MKPVLKPLIYYKISSQNQTAEPSPVEPASTGTEYSSSDIRSIVKEELEHVMREIFWEEAPKIIESIMEKQIVKLAELDNLEE